MNYIPKSSLTIRRSHIYKGPTNLIHHGADVRKSNGAEPYTVTVSATMYMMTSSNGNIFRVTGPLRGEFTGRRWIPRTKASNAELWCFLWSAPWINGWVNNREAGDLRHHRVHYDVIVMNIIPTTFLLPSTICFGQDSFEIGVKVSGHLATFEY